MRHLFRRGVFLFLAVFFLTPPLQAAVFTVNSTGDEPDLDPFGSDPNGVCLTAVGTCTLRAALREAAASSGSEIHFNIGELGGLQVITPSSSLPNVSLPTVIDGTTQLGFAGTPLIEIDGSNSGGSGLTISGGDSTIRGLVIHSFSSDGVILRSDNNVVEGNYIGTDPTGMVDLGNQLSGIHVSGGNNNLIGGTTVEARNVISGNNTGILVEQAQGIGVAQGNLIQGNYIGTNAAGTGSIDNGSDGVRIISAPNTLIGGETAGARNVISGNATGISISSVFNGLAIEGIIIQGNFIGTDATGTAGLGNSLDGISLGTVNLCSIGGPNASDRNVISANSGSGIFIANGHPDPQSLAGNLIQGNFIGTDVSGNTDLGNSTAGILLFTGGANNRIEGNTIAFNHFRGLVLRNAPGNTGDSILSNSIHSNSGLGIELNYPDGVTPNDTGDGDTGANNLQNFPVLTAANVSNGLIDIVGSLNSLPNTIFKLQFFSNTACDASGNGEGQTFLGEQNASTDAGGNLSFGVPGFMISFPAAGGNFITATATRLDQGDPTDTSEFSTCIEATIVGGGCGSDGTPCDDSNACTTNDACSGGTCVGGAAPNCDDGNACTNDSCNPASGCAHENNSNSCDDDNACTQTDICSGGTCSGSNPLTCPASDICHLPPPCLPGGQGQGEGDPCPPRVGEAIPGCCLTVADCPDDGNQCNGVATCIDHQCGTSSAVPVPPETDCQTFSCDPQTGEIITTNKQDGTSCNDNNACTANDICSGGTCVGGAAPNCNDGNACTNDSCNPASGCAHENNSNSCEDGNACTTNDTCSGGTCVGGAAPNCDDSNACTNDSCNPASGCAHDNNTSSCDDSNACTTSDACSNGSCAGGALLNCNDNNACTDDSCDPLTGCQHGLTSACNDNDLCTIDSCQTKKNGSLQCKHKRIMGCH